MSPKAKLLLIFAVSVAPIVLSYALYYGLPHDYFQAKTVGELLPIKPLASFSARTPEGRTLSNDSLKHKWLLLTLDNAACLQACQEKLYKMRQWRLAQGEEMDRLERVLLTRDSQIINPTALSLALGSVIGQGVNADFERQLAVKPNTLASDYIYLIDPLGNQVLRYDSNDDPTKVLSEVRKVMKNNKRLG